MNRAWWPALLIVILGAASAQGQAKLEWRFQSGEHFFAERVYVQKQTVEIKNKIFKEQRTKTLLTAITVKEKTPAGHVLDLKVEAVSFQTTGPPVSGGFDAKMAAKMQGCRFTATVTPQGKLVKFDGYDELIGKLADKNADVDKVLRVLLSEESLREDVEEIFSFLPDKAVTKGDKWKREALEPVPPFGSFRASIEYVLDKDEGDELGIGYTVKMSYRPPASEGDLFRVVKGGLSAEEGRGSIIFDVKKGWLVSSEKTIDIKGDLVIEAMGRQTQMTFTSVNTLRVRVFAKPDESK